MSNLWLVDFISRLMDDKFCGSIEISFFKGGITGIKKVETFKPPTS